MFKKKKKKKKSCNAAFLPESTVRVIQYYHVN